MNFRFLLFLALFITSLSATSYNNLHAAGPIWPSTDYPRYWMFSEGFYAMSLEGTYFLSTQNFDGAGAHDRPSTMSDIQYTSIKLHSGIGMTPTLSGFAQVSLASSATSNASHSNITDGRNVGFGDGFFALRYLLYRSSSANQEVPTEWRPNSFLLLLEPSWVFPLYDNPDINKPARGDKTNDLTLLVRGAAFIKHWLAISSYSGYTYRNVGFSSEIPFSLRGDIYFSFRPFIRGWLEWKDFFSLKNSTVPKSANTHTDAIPGGSLLFKGANSEQHLLGGGAALLIGRDFEAVGSIYQTILGKNSANGTTFSLGIGYRPYQAIERRMEIPKESITRATKPKEKEKTAIISYAYSVPIKQVSAKGNFVRIDRGTNQNVQIGEEFHLFPSQKDKEKKSEAAALAVVVSVRANSSFLKIKSFLTGSSDKKINTEFEAHRIIH